MKPHALSARPSEEPSVEASPVTESLLSATTVLGGVSHCYSQKRGGYTAAHSSFRPALLRLQHADGSPAGLVKMQILIQETRVGCVTQHF